MPKCLKCGQILGPGELDYCDKCAGKVPYHWLSDEDALTVNPVRLRPLLVKEGKD